MDARKVLELADFIKERDFILANIEILTIDEIKEHCNKYDIPIPNDETAIIGGLHKARLGVTRLNKVSDSQLKRLQNNSKRWLDKIGWSYEV